MGLVQTWQCDMCGKVLSGKVGTALVRERYLSLRGSLTVQDVDTETNKNIFTYITPSERDTLTFCNFECFKDYTNMREKQNQEAGFYFEAGSKPHGGGAALPVKLLEFILCQNKNIGVVSIPTPAKAVAKNA